MERIITACERVMTEAQDSRCHDDCPDKIKVDMMQIFLEMSMMDQSIDQKSPFITQLKDILHPLGITAGNQENDIKEEPVDYDEEPVENKRPRKERTNITTGIADQPQQEIQNVKRVTKMVKYPEREEMNKTQMTVNSESWLGAATTKEHFKNHRKQKNEEPGNKLCLCFFSTERWCSSTGAKASTTRDGQDHRGVQASAGRLGLRCFLVRRRQRAARALARAAAARDCRLLAPTSHRNEVACTVLGGDAPSFCGAAPAVLCPRQHRARR